MALILRYMNTATQPATKTTATAETPCDEYTAWCDEQDAAYEEEVLKAPPAPLTPAEELAYEEALVAAYEAEHDGAYDNASYDAAERLAPSAFLPGGGAGGGEKTSPPLDVFFIEVILIT